MLCSIPAATTTRTATTTSTTSTKLLRGPQTRLLLGRTTITARSIANYCIVRPFDVYWTAAVIAPYKDLTVIAATAVLRVQLIAVYLSCCSLTKAVQVSHHTQPTQVLPSIEGRIHCSRSAPTSRRSFAVSTTTPVDL